MDKENNIVYVKAKNGIYKCYKSEQMHKPIYYPVESKTNGYIDYYDVIDILSADDLYNELKKQKEVIGKVYQCIKDFLCSEEYINVDGDAIANNYKNILDILKRCQNEYKYL